MNGSSSIRTWSRDTMWRGIKAFSKSAFAAQFEVPGLVMMRATHQGTTVGAHLWYQHGSVVYSHLAAVNALGYELMASYALHWYALQTFAGEACWLNLGAGSGTVDHEDGGLTRFKRGWATGTRTAYLCGRIFHQSKYQAILQAHQNPPSDYFPAYRRGEFSRAPRDVNVKSRYFWNWTMGRVGAFLSVTRLATRRRGLCARSRLHEGH
jgi:hypothetical protein